MIDQGLPVDWPSAAQDAVSQFRQGDLVEAPPFFYAADGACPIWALTAKRVQDGVDASFPVLSEEQAPPYGIITTQSCDLTEQPPAGKTRRPCRPWFQIAPVSPAERFDDYQVKCVVEKSWYQYLVPLTPPGLEGLWLADLRIEMPIEKGWLVGRDPIRAFSDLADYRAFSSRLRLLKSRAASEGDVSDQMIQHLRGFLARNTERARQALEEVSGVMYEEHGPDRSPNLLTLHVFPKDDELPMQTRRLFDEWYDECVELCREKDCSLLPTEYEPSVSPDVYLYLVPLDKTYLFPD